MAVATTPRSEDPRVVLENVRWSTYEALLEDVSPARGKRLFYDRGTLEIMVTSPQHERLKKLLARLLECLTLELGISIHSLGQTTWRREVLRRGFEPDECYYIQSVDRIENPEEIDPETHPPPDLIIEIDISRSSVTGEGIYAAFGIRELWRFDGARLQFYELVRDGKYAPIERSIAFPILETSELDRFLARRDSMNETALLTEFRDWVRELPQG